MTSGGTGRTTYHHCPPADALVDGHRAQFELHLQGPGRGREADRSRAWGALRA
jgi:hypothetical protein